MAEAELQEIPEEAAAGRVAELYADIRQVLRTTQVNLLFRTLAVHEGYLAAAWAALRPNAQACYFERCADGLRMRMVPPMPEDVPGHAEELEGLGYPEERIGEIAGILDVYNYAGPKELILAAALKGALNGVRMGGVRPGHAEDAELLPLGAPPSMRRPRLADPARAGEKAEAVFEQIRQGSPGGALASLWRALGDYPEYLELAWGFVREQRKMKGFDITVSLSQGAAAAAAHEFPHPVVLSRSQAAAQGLSGAEADLIDRKLDHLIQLIPRTGSAIFFLKAALLGEGRVRRKPFEGE
ncbi:MAG: halocarboxylic acid dehydrogenase DehI family protein [Nitrospinota bacterium]